MPPRNQPKRASRAISRTWQLTSGEIDADRLQRVTDIIAAASTPIDEDLQLLKDIAAEAGTGVETLHMATVITVEVEGGSDDVIIDTFNELPLVTRAGPAVRINIERGGVAELELRLLTRPSASLYAWSYELGAAIEDALGSMVGPAEHTGPAASPPVALVLPAQGRLERLGAWAQTNRGAAIVLAATVLGAVVSVIGLVLYLIG